MRAMADVGTAVFVLGIKAEVHRYPFRRGEYRSTNENSGPTQARSDLANTANGLNCYILS
jgi:hypothetical protein